MANIANFLFFQSSTKNQVIARLNLYIGAPEKNYFEYLLFI